MPTYAFKTQSVQIDHGLHHIVVTFEDEIGDIVDAVGEDELLEYIGKEAAVKYFAIEEV